MNRAKTAILQILKCILPRRIRESLVHVSFHIGRSEFEKYAHKYYFAPNMHLGLAAVAESGFRPKTIIDVGAFEGAWSKMASAIWPSAAFLLIEPNLEKRDQLLQVGKSLSARVVFELLGAVNDQEVQFFRMESGSSVMEERSGVPRVMEKRILKTLDSLVENVESPILLKIDAQGYELQILRGAGGILPQIEGMLLEVSLIESNAGAPLLSDVIAFMKSIGYVAYEILELHRRPLDGALNQIDIFFVKEGSNLITDKRHSV